jgi:hypothetical protein
MAGLDIRAIFGGGGVSLAELTGDEGSRSETAGNFLVCGDPDSTMAGGDGALRLVCIFSMCWFNDFLTRKTLEQK